MTTTALIAGAKRNAEDAGAVAGFFRGSFLFFLFLPLPIIDSLNGMINGGGNDGVFSLGMAYRLCVILCCLFILCRGVIPKRFLLIAVAIILLILLPHAFDLVDGSFLSLTIKTLLPLLCIETFIKESEHDPGIHARLKQLINCWAILFPLCVLVPFALGIGFKTYGAESVGFKGFFYAQNDLCFTLSILFFFSFGKMFRHLDMVSFAQTALTCLCILMLGLKGGYILVIFSVVYWITKSELSMLRRFVFVVVIGVALLLLAPTIIDLTSSVISRWMYHSNASSSFWAFFSSGRVERIPTVFNYLNDNEANPLWFLFGAGTRYEVCLVPYELVEMDFVDLFFQFGLLGGLPLLFYYLNFLFVKTQEGTGHCRMGLCIALVMSLLAGHVLNSALSAMVFAILCSLVWSSKSVRTA